jgi:hypothetical protein
MLTGDGAISFVLTVGFASQVSGRIGRAFYSIIEETVS